MKQLFILSALFAVALALPLKTEQNNPEVQIISQFNNNNGLGAYEFSYQASDGSFRQEKATLRDPNDPNSPIVIEGSYGYIMPDGVTYAVHYIADESGYRIIKSAQ